MAVENKGILVGRSEAAGSLEGPHDDGTGAFHEGLEILEGGLGMVDGADRLSKAIDRAGALDQFKGQSGTGRDDNVVIDVDRPVPECEGIGLGIDRVDPLGDEVDPLFLKIWARS